MAESYVVPFVATTNAVISSSDANAGYAGNIRFFAQFISNPAAANLALISNGANGALFGTVPDVAMTNQKVNTVNPAHTTFGAITAGSGFFDVSSTADGPTGAGPSWLAMQSRHWNWGAGGNDYRWQLAVNFTDSTQIWARSVIGGAGSAWHRLYHSGMDGAGSGIDADLLDGNSSAHYATAASVAAIAAVPAGLIAAFRTAAAIATGWARFTDGDGRFLVGAGTTFSVTFTENTAVGSSWAHQHASTGLTATSGAIAAPNSGDNLVNNGAVTSHSTSSHTHPAPTITMGGNTANTTFTPVGRVVVWAQKS